jgi:hypothetical protein
MTMIFIERLVRIGCPRGRDRRDQRYCILQWRACVHVYGVNAIPAVVLFNFI